jgi:hypothetical protein
MNPDHALYATWDAAYVLGALSPDDRREFELHLDSCAECRRSVAQLAPTIGLLSRLSAADVGLVDEDAGPAPSVRDGLVSLAAERARRRRRTWWVAAVAAVVLVIAAVAVPLTLVAVSSGPTTAFALEDVADVPLQAAVDLTDVAWGTRIDLRCAYPESDSGDGGSWTYALAVVGTDGEVSTVSTWRAGPGTQARVSAGSALDVSDIAAIEIRAAGGQVLMRHELTQSGE